MHPFAKLWWQAVFESQFDGEVFIANPPEFPFNRAYVAQIRPLAGLAGWLHDGEYIIRAQDVLLSRGIRPAEEIRSMTGLRPSQKLWVSFHDDDSVLERLWSAGMPGIETLSQSGYDGFVAPSYSLWNGRSYFEWMINAERSIRVVEAFSKCGAPVIPNVPVGHPCDITRFASWCAANRNVSIVALDLQTSRLGRTWGDTLTRIGQFETDTGQTMRYLVNGTTAPRMLNALFSEIPRDRVVVTSATLAPPVARLQVDQFSRVLGDRYQIRVRSKAFRRRIYIASRPGGRRQGRE